MRAGRPMVDAATWTTLRRMILQESGRISRRAQAIVWWLEGATQTQASARIGMTRQSVHRWCRRFRNEGIAGRSDRKRTGRPLSVSDQAMEAVTTCLRGSDLPGTTGPGGWTVPLLVKAMATRGWVIGARTMRRVLARLGARWRRGQLVAKGDSDRAAVLGRLAEGLATATTAAERAHRHVLVLFEDEADLALLAHAGASWQLADQSAAIPTPGQNQSSGLFGSLSLAGDLLITEADRKTAAAFTMHLDAVVARFPEQEVAVVLDNVGIHHAKPTDAWFDEHPHVHRLFLPRYSPNDNAQERVWGWLRADVCRNRAFPDLSSKRTAAPTFVAGLTPASLTTRCVPTQTLARLIAETGASI